MPQWCEAIHSILQRLHVPLGARILDAGCGTGGYAIYLCRLGYQVTGVDISAEMIDQAQLKANSDGSKVRFEVADLLELEQRHGYDAILCRGVLNDLISDEDRARAFESFSSSLVTGGTLLLDVRNWDQTVLVKRQNPITEVSLTVERDRVYFRSETSLEAERHQLAIREVSEIETHGKTRRSSCEFVMRCWTPDELIGCLRRSGFSVIELLGDYDRAIPLGGTERIIGVAQSSPG